jgi:hypothetical protein
MKRLNKVIICATFLMFYLTKVLGQDIGKNFISIGSNFATVGNKTAYLNSGSIYTTPYVGAGLTVDYSRLTNVKFNSLDSNIPFRNRWFLGIGTRFNYMRYGMDASNLFPVRADYTCQIKNIQFNLKQDLSFHVSKSMIASLFVLEGIRISSLNGDSLVTNIYGLRNNDQGLNIRNFSVDVGIDLSFNIVPKFYFSMGYVNGLINIVRNDPRKYPVLREFYPCLKLTKFI